MDCNCNWGTCIAPPARRPRAHHRVNPYLGARRQNETEMFSDHDEMSPSIAAVSALSAACSMLAVQQQKRLCRQFVDVLPHNEVCSVDRPGILATDVRRCEIYSSMCLRSDLWTSKHACTGSSQRLRGSNTTTWTSAVTNDTSNRK